MAALLAIGLALSAPARARAELASEDDWRQNVSQREDEPGDIDWDDQELGGTKRPMFTLSNAYWITYAAYSNVVEAFCGTLIDIANDLFANIGSIADQTSFGYDGTRRGSEDENDTMARLYDLATRIQRDVVSKVALGFLGLSLGLAMLEHAKEMSQRGHEAMGTMASYLWLFAKYAIIMQLVNNADLLCGAIFNVFGWIAGQTSAIASAVGASSTDFGNFMISLQKTTYANAAQMWIYVILALVMVVVVATTVVRVLVTTTVRLIEVYVTAAFSGFPLIMLMSRQTKESGVRFFKSFAALCLQTAVLVLLVACSGIVISAATSLFTYGATGVAGIVIGAVGPIAGCIAVGTMVGHSRQLADRVMGV